jgi:hypothetical protein
VEMSRKPIVDSTWSLLMALLVIKARLATRNYLEPCLEVDRWLRNWHSFSTRGRRESKIPRKRRGRGGAIIIGHLCVLEIQSSSWTRNFPPPPPPPRRLSTRIGGTSSYRPNSTFQLLCCEPCIPHVHSAHANIFSDVETRG